MRKTLFNLQPEEFTVPPGPGKPEEPPIVFRRRHDLPGVTYSAEATPNLIRGRGELLPREKVPEHIEKALRKLTPAEQFVVLEYFRVELDASRRAARMRRRRIGCLRKFFNAYLSAR